MLRIGSGSMRGRKILSPPGRGTRPITGFVKKSLFDTLRPVIQDALVLDLFCGTGTLGLEALSNGASHVCFAELDRRVIDRLRRNINDCEVQEKTTIWSGDIVSGLGIHLGQIEGNVDLCFIDPPYALAEKWEMDRIDRMMFSPLSKHLSETGRVVFRIPGTMKTPENLGPLGLVRAKDYNDMSVGFYGFGGD